MRFDVGTIVERDQHILLRDLGWGIGRRLTAGSLRAVWLAREAPIVFKVPPVLAQARFRIFGHDQPSLHKVNGVQREARFILCSLVGRPLPLHSELQAGSGYLSNLSVCTRVIGFNGLRRVQIEYLRLMPFIEDRLRLEITELWAGDVAQVPDTLARFQNAARQVFHKANARRQRLFPVPRPTDERTSEAV